MSWFGELVIAEAFADTASPREGAIVATNPLAAPFCHNLPHPPLYFAAGGEAMLRRFGGSIWLEAPLDTTSRDASGAALLAGRQVLADLRGISPEAQAAHLARLSGLAGHPPALVRQGRDEPWPPGYIALWNAGAGGDRLWLAAGERMSGFGQRLLRFVRRHLGGEADALDTALGFAAGSGLVAGLRHLSDGGVALAFDPLWCLAGLGRDGTVRTMIEGRAVAGGGKPLVLALPPVPGPAGAIELGIEGRETAVRACRLRLDGREVLPRMEWRRGKANVRIDASGTPIRIALEGQGVAVTRLALVLPPPLDGLYGTDFPDPLDRYDLPERAGR